MNNIPCKNCITFPICKAQVISYINTHSNVSYTMPYYYAYQNVLSFKCTLIRRWAYESKINTFKHMDIIQTTFTQVFKETPII